MPYCQIWKDPLTLMMLQKPNMEYKLNLKRNYNTVTYPGQRLEKCLNRDLHGGLLFHFRESLRYMKQESNYRLLLANHVLREVMTDV
jgi:hypothetical protein